LGTREIVDGTIAQDIKQGFAGGLNGYRKVRDNAPLGVRLWLRGIMTVTETFATVGLSKELTIVYDMFSGAYSDTIITSRYGIYGYVINAYM